MSIDMVKGEKDWKRKNKTAVIEVSLDIRDLAYIIACYHASGVPISSKSAAVSIALSQFIEMLPRAFPNIPRPTSTAEAKAVVEDIFGPYSWTRRGKGLQKRMIEVMEAEDRAQDAGLDGALDSVDGTEPIAKKPLMDKEGRTYYELVDGSRIYVNQAPTEPTPEPVPRMSAGSTRPILNPAHQYTEEERSLAIRLSNEEVEFKKKIGRHINATQSTEATQSTDGDG